MSSRQRFVWARVIAVVLVPWVSLVGQGCGGGNAAAPPSGTGGTGAAGGGGTRGGTGAGGSTPGAGGSPGGGGGGAAADAPQAGATGGAGTGGAGTPPASGASVLERNKNPTRDAHFVDPQLTKANAAKMTLEAGFKATFTGQMWASPLFLENGPGGKGLFFAVTTSNDVFALDEMTGATVWTKNVGTPAMANGPNATCGSIHPLGAIATPVIDAAARTIYLSAAVGNATAILRQEVHALSVDDGSERPGWPVDVSGKVGFDPQPHNPRSALSLVKGIVYVAYGGHVGDCGNYHGRVVAIDTKDPTKVAGWATGGVGEAIWASGGMASDGDGVFATTGNRTQGGGAHQDSEQVVRVTGMATVARTPDNVFYPASWLAMDTGDADFGSSSPIVLEVPGATPSTLVVATAKTGHVYFLDSKKLGGMGGQLVDMMPGSSGFTAPAGYPTTKGMFLALTLNNPTSCPPTMAVTGLSVVGINVVAGAPVKPVVAWCAAMAAGQRYSPIATTIDGKNEALVWYMSGTKLMAVDGETGQTVFGGGAGDCAAVRKWTSPIAAKGRIIVGGDGHLCAWSPTP
jgi:hypothetical protein